MENILFKSSHVEDILDFYSTKTLNFDESEHLKENDYFEIFVEDIVYRNIESKYIEYIDTQLDVVYWYSYVGKRNQSNKVMVYLINDMIKTKNYIAIDYVLQSVDIKRLNSSSVDALRRSTSRLKLLNFRNKFINNLIFMFNNNQLSYELSDRFMLEE